ncbi:MAG TPA: hypothetical protein VMZ90_07300 [Vicinamibacterales bacterium]|nr:hypothetical protein [Vicinamibacterales bacterium]
MHGIRLEELAESVRNVYWLDHRLVYDGVYSNVGWYGTLLVFYKTFGFSLFHAKVVRLVIHLAGLSAVAAVLARAMPVRMAIVPLLVIGLSPSWLYFETLQTSFGLDVAYGAICLWLVIAVRPDRGTVWEFAKTGACGIVSMVAAMSYPVFLFYLPSLCLVFVWRWRRTVPGGAGRSRLGLLGHAAAGVAGAALPLAVAVTFVRNPSVLLFDPATRAGLFRGGGQLGFDPHVMWGAIQRVLADLFDHGQSYYFDVSHPDLSGLIAQAGFIVVALTLVYLAATKRIDRPAALSIALLAFLSVIVPSLTIDGEPGLRRSTGLLTVWFVSMVMVWRFYATTPLPWPGLRWAAVGLYLLLPIDSALKLPSLADDLGRKNAFQNATWFAIAQAPAASLDRLLASHDAGKPLACPVGQDGNMVPCRYQEVYAAIAGYEKWNGLGVRNVQAADWRTGEPIVLTPWLWIDGYYPTCTRQDTCREAMDRIFKQVNEEKANRR